MALNDLYGVKDLKQNVIQAIQAIAVGGQSYQIGSRSLTRANLSELRALLREIETLEAQDEQSPDRYHFVSTARFDGR